MVMFQVGNIYSKIIFPKEECDNIGAILKQILTVDVPGAKYLWSYKSGQWDGKVRLFDLGNDFQHFTFLSGMYPTVLMAMVNHRYTWQFEDQRGFQYPTLQPYTVQLRPYQGEVLCSAFASTVGGAGWWPRGILQVATGGGKTEIAVAMYQTYPVPTTFLVHRKDLLLQAQERFKKYGINAGIIGAGTFNPIQNLNIITMQTLMSIKKRGGDRWKRIQGMLQDTQQVFFDEAHIMASNQDKGNQFVQVAELFPNAHARWGLTATPFMRSQYDNCLLEGVTGSVLARVTSEYLISQGYLTPPKVNSIKVPGKLPMTINYKASNKAKAEHWRKVQDKGIITNTWRNQRIAQEINKGPFPLLVLVKTIEQANLIKVHAPNVPLLTSANSAQQRRDMAEKLRNGTVPALICSTIWDEGIDLPEIKKVILASGGKSQVKLLQRIGRGLRISEGKSNVEIIDFGDQHNPLLKRHADERKKILKAEGFEVEDVD